MCIKPLSVTTNVVGLQTDDAGHLGKNSSGHVARVLGLQTDAVDVTETRLSLVFLQLFVVGVVFTSYIDTNQRNSSMKIYHL